MTIRSSLVNWTNFWLTSAVAVVAALLQVWLNRDRKPQRLLREAAAMAQLAVALKELDGADALRDQAEAAALDRSRRALSTAKPPAWPAFLGLVAIPVLALVVTLVLPDIDGIWGGPTLVVLGVGVAAVAYGIEMGVRFLLQRRDKAPADASRLAGPTRT